MDLPNESHSSGRPQKKLNVRYCTLSVEGGGGGGGGDNCCLLTA